MEAHRSEIIDSWRQTRLLAYLIAQPNLKDQNKSIYEFYPLPDDPTQSQIEEKLKQDQENDGKWMKNVIDNFRKTKRK